MVRLGSLTYTTQFRRIFHRVLSKLDPRSASRCRPGFAFRERHFCRIHAGNVNQPSSRRRLQGRSKVGFTCSTVLPHEFYVRKTLERGISRKEPSVEGTCRGIPPSIDVRALPATNFHALPKLSGVEGCFRRDLVDKPEQRKRMRPGFFTTQSSEEGSVHFQNVQCRGDDFFIPEDPDVPFITFEQSDEPVTVSE